MSWKKGETIIISFCLFGFWNRAKGYQNGIKNNKKNMGTLCSNIKEYVVGV